MLFELAHELRGTARRSGDLARVAPHFRRRVLVRGEETRIARDRGEEVVQVVRDRVEVCSTFSLPQGKEMCHGWSFGKNGLPL